MTHVFHRQLKSPLPVAVSGQGAYIIDSTGKRYLDASGGAAVSCLGHSDREVVAAVQAQLDRLPFAHTGFFTTQAMEDLADRLVATAPAGLEKVYFVSGGSEAVEAALKLARQACLDRGEPGRELFVARRQSYHGNTLGALAVGGNAWRREPFQPLLMPAEHIAPCYAYREQEPGESDEAYGLRAADALEAKLQEVGPERVIAFVAETVVGATLGAVPPAAGYFRRIREICDRHGVLLILDEVMSGMGRTGHLYACAEDGIAPDLLCIAKGLGAGYQPLGAVLCSGAIYATIQSGTGYFQHGHTYAGHAAACAGGLAVQKAIAERDLLPRVRSLGAALAQRLQGRFGNHPHVGDIRGRGLFQGIELVADRGSKEPFDPDLKLHARIKARAFEGGLICYPMGGTIDGVRGDHVLLAPPFILEDEQLDEVTDKLAMALDLALADIGHPA
ncbi:MAG: aspartate aminotransferase family protein [Sneathiellaceae bacterium]